MEHISKIEELLSGLPGVKNISRISGNSKDKILDLEKNYENNGKAGLYNLGIRKVFECDIIISILKNSQFRPPPGSTVFLVEDVTENSKNNDYILNIDNKKYYIIGEELIGKKPSFSEEHIFISDDFVMYPGRRENSGDKPAYFLIPPIGFPELENLSESLSIRNIVSISPSTGADDYIRELCGFSPNKDFATILVGYDIGIKL